MRRLTSYILIAIAITFLASCSSLRLSNFTHAKYTKYGHNDPVVQFNKINSQEIKVACSSLKEDKPAVESKAPEQATQTAVIEKTKLVTLQRAIKVSHKRNLKNVPVIQQENLTDAKLDMPSASYAPDEVTGSSDGNRSNIDPVVLIILAIFLSPLAVYLYDNAANSRFWIDFVLWILGVGFGLGVYSLAFLLWLAAVVYAILIVTGSISAA